MSDTVDTLWLESATSTVRGMNIIFATCPIVPEVLHVIVHAMWDLCEQTSAPVKAQILPPSEVQIAARSLLVSGTWGVQEQSLYEVLLKLTGELPAPSLPPVSE